MCHCAAWALQSSPLLGLATSLGPLECPHRPPVLSGFLLLSLKILDSDTCTHPQHPACILYTLCPPVCSAFVLYTSCVSSTPCTHPQHYPHILNTMCMSSTPHAPTPGCSVHILYTLYIFSNTLCTYSNTLYTYSTPCACTQHPACALNTPL